MRRYCSMIAALALVVCSAGRAQNLLKNSSFEARDPQNDAVPEHWGETSGGAVPLEFTTDHYHGATGGMIVADGQAHMWRQNVVNPPVRTFTLSGFVKAEGVTFATPDEYAYLYGHILYKGLPYSAATHFLVKIPEGTYDWKPLSVAGGANPDAQIDLVHVSVMGKLSSGRVIVDQVELTENREITAEALLARKVDDLLHHLERVTSPDDSVAAARQHLLAAKQKLSAGASGLEAATASWIEAARTVSHEAWAAMFPEAMSDRPVEAQMLYHGLANTQSGCDRYLDIIEQTGCNGVYHSLGSWMHVIHHSELFPIEESWKEFDALAYSIAEAKKRGIKSYAYLAALYGTHQLPDRADSLHKKHPEWFAKGPIPNMPTFPDPAHPEVMEFIVSAYTELAHKYDLDGIGLDYIRYPSETALNFDENNRRQIMDRYGIDIMEGEVWKDPQKWEKIREYRAEKVAHIVQRVREAVKKVKPQMAVMACLISDPDMAARYGQRWANSSKWIDYASPMNYDDLSKDLDLLNRQRSICQRNNAAYIPAIGGMPETHQAWTISTWAERVAIQRRNGCDGMIIYRMGGFDPAVSAFFGNGPFHSKAKFPGPPAK